MHACSNSQALASLQVARANDGISSVWIGNRLFNKQIKACLHHYTLLVQHSTSLHPSIPPHPYETIPLPDTHSLPMCSWSPYQL